MPQIRTFYSEQPFMDQPRCPMCGSRMWLDHIEPDEPDHDKRTFECPRCQHVESVIVNFR
jgi:hypothetical protein